MSSIKTLIKGAEEIAGIDTHQMSCKVKTGYRPVTLDTTPIIGEVGEHLYCIYGTKRDGFTWAPFFAKCVANELRNTHLQEWEELKELCNPYRKMISAGSVAGCTKNYIFNKRYEAEQHGKKLRTEDIYNLENIAKTAHEYIEKSEGKIGLDPEVVNTIYYSIQERA